jgi:hypothetical protein
MILMAVIDLQNIVKQRLMDIARMNPSMTAEETYFDGESGLWCLIAISGSDGRTIEYDFIESEDSWRRTDVAIEYSLAALEQVKVLVIVPDMALAGVLELVKDYGAEGIFVSDHSAMELVPLPLAY